MMKHPRVGSLINVLSLSRVNEANIARITHPYTENKMYSIAD